MLCMIERASNKTDRLGRIIFFEKIYIFSCVCTRHYDFAMRGRCVIVAIGWLT